MTKKMQFIKSVDSKFPRVPTHIYSLEFSKRHIVGKKVLDIGCWNGAFEYLLKDIKTSLTGVDPDAGAIRVAKKNFPKYRFVKGDVYNLPFRKTFDTVLLWMTMEHLPNERKALANMNKVLKKGGRVFLSTPSNRPLSILFDFPYFLLGHKHFNPKKLQKYFEQEGFVVEKIQVVGGFFVALRVSLLLFNKHFLRRALPPMPYVEDRQLKEYRTGKGFNEIFIQARKVREV